MAMWNRCAICGRAIPVGELCYGIKNWHGEPTNGDTICKDCLVPENALTLTPPSEPLLLEFDVVDTTTGKYPDWERIAREESWAKGLVYCDMDGIAIREDGSLILLDECGNCVSCPPDRFEIRRRPPEGEADA